MKVDLLPIEQLLFSSDLALVGQFDCDRQSRYFRDSGPTQNYLVVFPRTSVEIRHDNGPSFVSTPTNVNFYERGQKYVRGERMKEGDRCDWIALSPDLIAEAIGPVRVTGSTRLFRQKASPASSETFLAQRRYIRALKCGRLDPLAAEEGAIALVQSALKDAGSLATGGEATARQREAVEEAKMILAASRQSDASLQSLAAQVGLSPFHLCRSFSRVTGVSLVRYRTELRLRRALDVLEGENRPLTDLALDHGFSSHAHFTASFTRSFGAPPSRLLSLRNADASNQVG